MKSKNVKKLDKLSFLRYYLRMVKKQNKNPVGHPPLFRTKEALQAKIDLYFKEGATRKEVIINRKKEIIVIPTITGLCYYLGFESRQSFYDYGKRQEFSYTVKRARTFIEQEYEEQLRCGNTIGAILALKNFGWTDRQELEHTGANGKDLFPENKMSSDKIKQLIAEKINKLKKINGNTK